MYNINRLILPVKQFNFFKKSQFWTREQVNEYQDKKLIEIVQHAGKNVPYYRNLFKKVDLNPETFKGRDDITKIPFLDKNVLRTRYKEFVADNADKYGLIWEKTSGSTGTPLNIAHDFFSRASKWAATARAYFWAGYKWGNGIFYIKGMPDTQMKDYFYKISNNSINFNSSRLSKINCINIGKILLKKKPSFYAGYPRSLLMFSKILKDEGIPIHIPGGIFCYGETLTSDVRKMIEKTYKSPVYDFYSHTENAVMICETNLHNKYLIEDYFYPEIINETGDITDNGRGELVGTSFYNYSMPLIRYRTRDIINISRKNSENNRSFVSVNEIEGRKDDYIITPDGRYLFLAEGAINYAKGVISSQYIQDAIDHIIINLIVDDNFKESYFNEIKTGLKIRFGNLMKFDFKIVEELEKKGTGKIPFIINRLKIKKNETEL